MVVEGGCHMSKTDELKQFFADNFESLYQAMLECDHGCSDNEKNPYHLEGSVWTHTQMVLDALSNKDNSTLLVAALLHDLGKPFTRTVEDSRVWFKNHPARGTFEAIDVVGDIYRKLPGFEDTDIINVLNLISLHHLFFNYFQNNVEKAAAKIHSKLKGFSLEFIEMLRELCMADCTGRLSATADDSIARFEEIFSVVKELHYDDHSNHKYQAEVVFNIGIPYSGKSYATISTGGYTIISRDDILLNKFKHCMYNEAWELADHDAINQELMSALKAAVAEKKNIIVDMTNLRRKSRNILRNVITPEYKKIANVYYAGLKTIYERMHTRTDKYISWNIIENMMNSYSLPIYDEFDEINFILQP